jgi:hypothetical protein
MALNFLLTILQDFRCADDWLAPNVSLTGRGGVGISQARLPGDGGFDGLLSQLLYMQSPSRVQENSSTLENKCNEYVAISCLCYCLSTLKECLL